MNSEEAWGERLIKPATVLEEENAFTGAAIAFRDGNCDFDELLRRAYSLADACSAAEYERGKAERDPLEMLEALARRYIDVSIAPPMFDLSVWWREGEMVYFMVEGGKEYEGTHAEAEALLKGQEGLARKDSS